MPTELLVPKLGMGMAEGTLTEWHFADGSPVTEGSVLYSLETDKTVTEIEAPVGGILRIVAEEGMTYEVGALLGRIE